MDNWDKKIKKRIVLFIVWTAVTAWSAFWLYDYSISNIGFSPSQPVQFSHKAHIEKYGMKCIFCHYNAEKNEFSNIPSTHACMTCHVALRNESDLIKPLNLSQDRDSTLVWKRLYRLPDFVHFSHKAHLRVGIDCSSCHGSVELTDSLSQIRRLTMKQCLACHREPEKYIMPARDVSGIFVYPSKNKNKLVRVSDKAVSEPQFGKFKKQARESFHGIDMPCALTRGPENCSACHY
jgi:hypothetical protein